MKLCPACQRCYEDTDQSCSIDDARLNPSRLGSRLIADKYRLDRRLGRGGMGAVYAGTHVELDRPIAVKLLLSDFTHDTQALERFRREARAAARLNHQNVADTYDYGALPDGGAYIVMELVDGITLREHINQYGQLPILETLTIAQQVAHGIEAAHRRGIIHRDLKPANIMLTHDAHDGLLAKVLDFGIAKLKEHTQAGNTDTLTSQGILIGTPRYMSPEQCAGEELDARSDIYSLGVIIYEMLAQRPPFDAPSATAIALKHIRETPPPLPNFRPDVPDALARLVMQTLNKQPDERPQSAAELAARLRAIQTSLGFPAAHYEVPRGEIVTSLELKHSVGETNASLDDLETKLETDEQARDSYTVLGGVPTTEDVAPKISQDDKLTSPPTVASNVTVGSPDVNRATPKQSKPAAPNHDGTVQKNQRQARAFTPDGNQITASASPTPNIGVQRVSNATSYRTLILLSLTVFIIVAASAFWFASRSQRSAPATNETLSESAGNPVSKQPTYLSPISNQSSASTQNAAPTAPVASSNTIVNTDANQSDTGDRQSANVLALRTALNDWVAATNAKDVAKQVSFYAPTLNRFYQARNVSRAAVQIEKSRLFTTANTIEMRVGGVQINVQPDGRNATMRFYKRYNIEGNGQSRSGEVEQKLDWTLTSEGWKITTEYDVRVLS